MSKRQKELLAGYLKGLAVSYIAMILFGAFELIVVGEAYNIFVALAIITLTMWTTMYVAGFAVWVFAIVLASVTLGIGLIIAMPVAAATLIKVTNYLIPSGVATFTSDVFGLLVIGTYYCFAFIIFYPEE